MLLWTPRGVPSSASRPKLAREIGAIDILVNNAGMMQAFPYDNYPEDIVDDMLAVNLRAPVAFIGEFAKGMV